MKIKKALQYLPAFFFILCIFAFMILYFVLPKSDHSSQEKRNLAEFPETNAETIFEGKFQRELDTYLSDHIPGRNLFAGIGSFYELLCGQNGSKGIYLGSEGYLFPKPSKNKENLLKNAEYISEFADSSDIPVYMTLIPSSGFINKAYLPINHEVYNDDELIKDFSGSLSKSVRFKDITEDFLSEWDSKQLYYKTDHHWTSEGAYECYSLLGGLMDYAPVPESSFRKERINNFYGTSYSKSALWTVSPDKMDLWSNQEQPEGSVKVEIRDGSDVKSSESYFFLERLNEDDKYPVFLDGNHSLVTITNSAAKGGTLVVIKDSYAHTIVPFLSQNYSKIIMADLRYYKKEISALAEEENADAVLILYSLDNLSADNNLAYLF